MDPIIKIDKLRKSYGDLHVIKDITTQIQKGEVVSIIGPSGTGKSTFLRCLNLLEKPDGGRIEVCGVEVTAKKAPVCAVRQKMGMVFQNFCLFDHLTVLENLMVGPMKLKHVSKEAAAAKGRELLQTVGLASKENAYPKQLSGGQKQRVAIARCLAMDPEIILFDEPTSALDPTMVSEVLGVIRRLASEGMTMLIVTHEMGFAHDVSTRIFYMDEGGIYEDGSPAQVFDAPLREKTRAFIHRIRNFRYAVADKTYDAYQMNTAITQFCNRHFFPAQRVQALHLLAEESLVLLLEAGVKGIQVGIDFMEKDQETSIFFEYAEGYPSLQAASQQSDGLGMTIIQGLTSSVHEEVTQAGNHKTTLKLK